MNMQVTDRLACDLSLVDPYIESFGATADQFVLHDFQNSLEVGKLVAAQITQPANMPVGDQESVAVVHWVPVMNRKKGVRSRQHWSVALDPKIAENASGNRVPTHRWHIRHGSE
jgi:hypothetical protein